MKSFLGLSDEVRLEAGQLLNQLLADEYGLDANTRNYRWNISGPNFHDLHLLFSAHHVKINQWLDDVAERARGGGNGSEAVGNLFNLAKPGRFSADSGLGLFTDHMLYELLALHEDLAVQLCADVGVATQSGDNGTADFLTGLLQQHEKASWMLRAHLETAELETFAQTQPIIL